MSFEITGTVVVCTATEQVTEKVKVKKRELVLECGDNPQYMQKVKFEAINDRCSLLDGVNPGAQVTIHFNLNGREWVNKEGKTQYFNTLAIWKVDKGQAAPVYAAPAEVSSDDDSDLPF